MAESSKKRSANYTAQEKESLLCIIKEFKHIIENKETNAVFSKKKNDTWHAIAEKYNAQSVTGPRTGPQLKHLYINLKQKARKDVALENRKRYDSLMDRDHKHYDNTELFSQSQINEIKKKAVDDKKEILKTGGGSFKPTLSESDSQVLALMGTSQIKPLQNPYDDAAVYFGDHIVENENVYLPQEVIGDHIVENENVYLPQEVIVEISEVNDYNLCAEPVSSLMERSTEQVKEGRVHDKTNENLNNSMRNNTKTADKNKEKTNIEPSMNNSHDKENIRVLGTPKNPTTKQKYFNMKLKNAMLERKFLLLKNKREAALYKLKMQLIRRKLKNMPLKKREKK